MMNRTKFRFLFAQYDKLAKAANFIKCAQDFFQLSKIAHTARFLKWVR